MTDVVITVPQARWFEWLAEGGLPGERGDGLTTYGFTVSNTPKIEQGERVYVVSHGKLRGWAPLWRLGRGIHFGGSENSVALIRCGNPTACTIPEKIPGFRGFRYRWWEREDEYPFAEWMKP